MIKFLNMSKINKIDYLIFIVKYTYKYMTTHTNIFDSMRYNNSNEHYKNTYNYYTEYIYKDYLITENAIIFLKKYDKHLEHRYEYIIDLLDSGSAVCNDVKTYLEVSTVKLFKNLKEIRVYVNSLEIENIELINTEEDGLSRYANNNRDFKLYMYVFNNIIQYVINNLIKNLKLYKVLFSSSSGESLPILLELLKNEFEQCNFNYIYFNKDFENESLIEPFIRHLYNRNSIYINNNLSYNVLCMDNYGDKFDINEDYREEEIQLLKREYSLHEEHYFLDIIRTSLFLTIYMDNFNRLIETEHLDESGDYYLIENDISMNIENILDDAIEEIDNTSLRVNLTSYIKGECCCCFELTDLVEIIPCSHKVICITCINKLQSINKRTCPICRSDY